MTTGKAFKWKPQAGKPSAGLIRCGGSVRQKLLVLLLVALCFEAVLAKSVPWSLIKSTSDNKPSILVSPDGKWRLRAVFNGGDTAVVSFYDFSLDGWSFGNCVEKGSGELTLPVFARCGDGTLYYVDFANECFADCAGIKRVIVPEDLDVDLSEALLGIPKVTSYVVEDGNEFYYSLDDALFLHDGDGYKHVLLRYPNGKTATSYVIPEGVEAVSAFAFENYGKVKTIRLPESLQTWGSYSDWGYENEWYVSSKLESFTIAEGNPHLKLMSGDLYSGDGKTLLRHPPASKSKSVSVKQGTETIAPAAFTRAVNLSSISMPKSLRSIGCCAFAETGLTNVIVPEGVTEISDAFCGARKLCSVSLPETLAYIDNMAFDMCTSLKYVDIANPSFDASFVCWGECLPARFGIRIPAESEIANETSGFFIDASGRERPVQVLGIRPIPVIVETVIVGDGSVLGGGASTAMQKVTLKAVAQAGSVFAGWYADEACRMPFVCGVDFRTPSFPYVVPSRDVTVYARFIPVSEDVASVRLSVADEYAPKVEIEPVAIDVSGCTSLPTVKVKGLPPGLKFTAKALDVKATKTAPAAYYAANTVYGTPAKSGVYTATFTVTTAGKHTASTNVAFTVLDRAAGESFLKVACDSAMGKATGAGIYVAGKKVALKATPQKGYVFAGWHDDGGTPLVGDVDYRSPSFPYMATGVDTTVRAEFAPVEEDASLELLVDEVYNTSGEFDLLLAVNSISLPKVSISGLPSGIKFDAKSLRIAGTATKPGTYTVTAKLTNATVKKAITQKFDIVVDNLTGANGYLKVTDAAGGATPLMNGRGERYVMSVGVQEFDLPVLNAANVGDKVTLSGLPAGLKYNAKTGRIEGVATKSGTFTVQANVKSGKASLASTFTVEVMPLPSWAVGTFAGVGIVRLSGYSLVEDNLYGTVTIGATGKVSGKFLFDTGDDRLLSSTFSAPALTSWEYDPEGGCYYFDVKVAFKDGRDVVEYGEFRFCIEQNNYDGGIGGGMISARDIGITLYQNVWKVKGFENLPVFAEKKTVASATETWKDGGVNCTATLTLTIDPKGGVSVVLVEEGVYGGETLFRDRYARKDDLIVTHHWTERAYDGTEIDCYKAEIPFICATVEMRTSADGKVHADGCKVVD